MIDALLLIGAFRGVSWLPVAVTLVGLGCAGLICGALGAATRPALGLVGYASAILGLCAFVAIVIYRI